MLRCKLQNFSQDDERLIERILRDPQGWPRYGVNIRLVSQEPFDFSITLMDPLTLNRLYPHSWLRGLSLTDRRKKPRVFIHGGNWNVLPRKEGCEFKRLKDYRTSLINHEIAHVLGFDHVDCIGDGYPMDIRQQPSKGLGGCLPSASVHLYKSLKERR